MTEKGVWKSLTGKGIFLLTALATGLNVFWGPAQEKPPVEPPRITVDVEVVSVYVTVRDGKGGLTKGLVLEDFTLSEDGRPQAVEYFARESDLPLTVGLLVDTTPSESNMLDEEREVSRAFLNSLLRPGKDKAFIIQYSDEVELLQDVTASSKKLEKALDLLEPHGFGGGPGGMSPYATALADAVFLASDEILNVEKGRKALIILGDGDHIGDRMAAAVEAAQKADALIYAIRIYDKDFGGKGGGWRNIARFPPLGGPGGNPGGGPGGAPPGPRPGGGPSDGKKNLQELCRRTGGTYFEISKKKTLEQVFADIGEELRSQYCLGYTPEADARKGFRTIKVAVRRKGLVAQAREGYFPKYFPK